MPSIELVSIGQVEAQILPPMPFAVHTSPKLISHRLPSPLWQADFDALAGWMYHLGNPQCADAGYRGCYFAYDLLDRRNEATDKDWMLLFASEFQPGVASLIDCLLRWSPSGQVLFTTDWQFGPEKPFRSMRLTIDEFWQEHERGTLRLNALYPIERSR